MPNITARVCARAKKKGVVVLGRKEWGSRHNAVYQARRALTKAGHWGRFREQADTVVQHITVTRPSGDFKKDCRTVEQIGMDRFGSGVSYNFLVDMTTGHVAVGQPLDAKGTHTVNDKNVPGFSHDQNLVARAIAVVGMPDTKLSIPAKRAIKKLLQAMVEEGAITEGFDYVPHSMFAWKDCPCDSTRKQMPKIRKAVARALSKA